MTIYSQHPNRGKTQVLATFSTAAGLSSSTVTSLETQDVAAAITDALNRISACLTLPLSVWDTRTGFRIYPDDHLAQAADRRLRANLLTGAHSLWYEYAKMLLHEALEDLDAATGDLPATVKKAVDAELGTEVEELQSAWAQFTGSPTSERHPQRIWDFDFPALLVNGGLYELREETRDAMNDLEKRIDHRPLEESVEYLRLLFAAQSRCSAPDARLAEDDLSILVEPADQPDLGYFLSVDAPRSDITGRTLWRIEISRWTPGPGYSDDEGGEIVGEPLVTCSLASSPTVSQIIDLLDRVGTTAVQLAEWSRTPIGDTLAGTGFVVTQRRRA